MGTSHRSWWYAEHHENTQCKCIAECICFKNVVQMTAISVYKHSRNSAKKKGMTVSGTVSHTTKLSQLRGASFAQKVQAAKCSSRDQYNAKKALMNTGACFSQRRKLLNYLLVIPSFLEKATPSFHHGGVMFFKRPHIANTIRTTC